MLDLDHLRLHLDETFAKAERRMRKEPGQPAVYGYGFYSGMLLALRHPEYAAALDEMLRQTMGESYGPAFASVDMLPVTFPVRMESARA
jgi:hypothetical protein